ncbi:NfeD family protein [Amaricoccus solimangrovi]|uniref:Nodulation protein NfeD n=1 Tax=Amaricoccus solimangrovi TaxID=2589815 RepID=A0A501WNP3_9RHOB|nr:nodulation protein NfeD [Amaricoccus solimangrovi]TPE50948.1 nodulation protein NfeD [Amaricoccus solimangrovi]
MRRLALLAALAAALALAAVLSAQAAPVPAGGPRVVLMTAIEGPIGPATVKHVDRVIRLAEDRRAAALVLRIDTPGGLAEAMRRIVSAILASRVPVIGYVAPSGGHAASAGTYILYATHVAAMAPGTNLGAATPVRIGGLPEGLPGGAEKPAPEDAHAAKATNDAVALIRSLAEMRGRNADWAERAVRQAESLSAEAALREHVIDIVARNLPELLAAADGRIVEVDGAKVTLAVAGPPVETVEMSATTRLLAVLSNPDLALVLMMIGIYGLIFEFLNPGAVAPGVIGAICLTLALYGLNQLPLDYAGLALIGLGAAFMAFEAVTPSFGVLGAGGLVAFVLGASILIETDVPEYQISWWTIAALGTVGAAAFALLLGATIRAYRRAPASGRARMTSAPARVLEWSGEAGFVWAEGERWQAAGPPGLKPGEEVRVRGREGLVLHVEAAPGDGVQERG